MNKEDIKKRFEAIIKLLKNYSIITKELDSIVTFFYDIDNSCEAKYENISLPSENYLETITTSKIALSDHYSLNIYTHLEGLYTSIIQDFDTSYNKNNIWNIKLKSFIEKNIYKTSEGKKIKKCSVRSKLIENISTTPEFDNSISPVYSIIHNYIEWRGANAHFSKGNRQISLDDSLCQIERYKDDLINLYDKFRRYLNEIKNPSFTTKFEDYV